MTLSPRITTRIDLETQELLSKASAIMGLSSINSFVLSSAIEKAKEIMKKEEMLLLSQKDSMILVNVLDEVTKENKKLKNAFVEYEKLSN